MFLQYNFHKLYDGSYKFVSDANHSYLVYFFESSLTDAENNIHIINNMGFSRNGEHSTNRFEIKYDGRIRSTIMSIVRDFFTTYDHKTLIYFCFGDDGYGRQRNIVFNQWCRDLDDTIEKFNEIILYQNEKIYGSLMIVKDNPLKNLIVSSFKSYIAEIQDKES